MNKRKSDIHLQDIAVFSIAGILIMLFGAALVFAHAQLDEEPPENVADLSKQACLMANWETNGSYQFNESTETCEQVTIQEEVNRSG